MMKNITLSSNVA